MMSPRLTARTTTGMASSSSTTTQQKQQQQLQRLVVWLALLGLLLVGFTTFGSPKTSAFLVDAFVASSSSSTHSKARSSISSAFRQGLYHQQALIGQGLPSSSTCLLAATTTLDDDDDVATISADNLSTKLSNCLETLNRAADTKTEDSTKVLEALLELEQLSRFVGKLERGQSSKPNDGVTSSLASTSVASQLNGSWRLVFTTGTVSTQKKLSGQRINYFPIKAVQSFNTSDMTIANGIYLFDSEFALLQFRGRYDFNTTRRRLDFDFDELGLFNNAVMVQLQSGQAAQLGAASGLGSSSNVENMKKKKLPFFNWISADATIATARGGGGGLALWKRVA